MIAEGSRDTNDCRIYVFKKCILKHSFI